VRHRSRKQQQVYREQRIPLVKKVLEDQPVCIRCFRAPSTDVHELKSRARGGSITDESNVVAICRNCHTWITTHPAEAEAAGWSKHSWDKS